jgi:hypothetical protein
MIDEYRDLHRKYLQLKTNTKALLIEFAKSKKNLNHSTTWNASGLF